MSDYSPRLVISKSNGDNEWVFELTQTMLDSQYVIGRYIGEPDIPLGDGEDDELCISKIHCLLVKKRLGWHIKDCSVNGSCLARNNNEKFKLIPEKDYLLLHNDEILIQDYRLRFEDPAKTRPLIPSPPIPKCPWVFNVGKEKLYRIDVDKRTEEHLSRQLRMILKYMAEKNLKYGQGQICTYEELMTVIEDEKSKENGVGIEQIYVIAQKIRNILSRIEYSSEKDTQKWLESIAKMGYRLKIVCEN